MNDGQVTLDDVREAAASAARAARIFARLSAMNQPLGGTEREKAMQDYHVAKAEMTRTSRALEVVQEMYAWGIPEQSETKP